MRRVLGLLLLAVAVDVARAEEAYAPPEFLAQTPPLPPGRNLARVWRLDLTTAIATAVKQNLDIVLERSSVEQARLGVEVARGAFEPRLDASYQHRDDQLPTPSTVQGEPGGIVSSIVDGWRFALSQRFSTGTVVQLDYTGARSRTTAADSPFPRVYSASVGVSVTQPLLRGFSTDLAIPRLEILRATIADERQREQLVVAMSRVIVQTESAYWDVLQALYRYDLAVRITKSAEEQLALTRRQVDSGMIAPSDLTGAESEVASRRLDILAAEQAIEATSDVLRSVLNLPPERWADPILPVDVPRFVPGQVTVEEAVAIAAKTRPELAQLELDLRLADLNLRRAENDQLPQIDLGLSGTVFGQESVFGEALAQLGGADRRGWAIGLNLSWTPLNRATRANAAITRLQMDQLRVRQQQQVVAVLAEVRDAVRSKESAARQVLAASQFRKLAEQSLDIEQRKFLNGTSSNLNVAQRQDALLQSRISELAALLNHTRAATSLSRATGKLLTERRIELR